VANDHLQLTHAAQTSCLPDDTCYGKFKLQTSNSSNRKCSLKFAKKMNSWFIVTPGEHSSQNVGSNEQTQARVEVGKCFIKFPKNQPTIHW
jgi:hypothetical protein